MEVLRTHQAKAGKPELIVVPALSSKHLPPSLLQICFPICELDSCYLISPLIGRCGHVATIIWGGILGDYSGL